MTNSQERQVKRIRRDAEKWAGLIGNEVKRFEVEDYKYFVSVVAEIGLPGDEGTVAEFLRETAHIFIGKRGRMYYPIHRILKDGRYKHYYKAYEDFYKTYREQKV